MQAKIDLAPELLASEREYSPQFIDLSIDNMKRALSGANGEGGFLALLKEAIPEINKLTESQTSSQRAADIADVAALGPKAQEALRSVDPAKTKLLDLMTKQATDELERGSALDPYQSRNVQQAVRAGQSARGFGLGPADMYEEALATSEYGDALRNNRRAFAGNVVNTLNASVADPFLAILGRPSVNVAQGNNIVGAGQGIGSSPGPSNYFNPFDAYSADVYNTNYNAEAASNINGANNDAAITGAAIGSVGAIAGAGIMAACWVAREVYGADNPKWVQFRSWLFSQGPKWFQRLYLAKGEAFAGWIHNKPKMKSIVRWWMDRQISKG